MAIRKAATSYNKKKIKPKSKPSIFRKIILWFFSMFIIAIVGAGTYYFRDGLLYYLGFKTNKSSNELSQKDREIADVRIYEVLSTHENSVFGFDVSEYQGRIKWDEIGKVEDTFELSFVFIRATAGGNRVDKKFKRNWKEAKNNNFICGAYHYYRPNENSIAQADNFIKTVTLNKGDFPPVLDIEKLPKTQSIDSLKVGLRRWLNKVEKHYKVKPIIYSGESYYTDFLKDEFSDYPFWIANYNLWKKKPEKGWLMWQFTEKGKVEGINGMVDLNVFNGNFVKFISNVNP
jgi:lysozyme